MSTAEVQTAAASAVQPAPDLVRIRDLVYQVAGIFQPGNKLHLLRDRN